MKEGMQPCLLAMSMAQAAPMMARGRVPMMLTGCRKERKDTTSTR